MAGRECAQEVLRALGIEGDVGVGGAGEPIWPEGVIGSITHSAGRAHAVATRHGAGIGIDLEPVMSAERADRVASTIATPEELARLPVGALTLVFSAKETLFKALYPQVRSYFDFLDAAVIRIDDDITIALVRTLAPSLRAGTRFRVGYRIDNDFVMTGLLL